MRRLAECNNHVVTRNLHHRSADDSRNYHRSTGHGRTCHDTGFQASDNLEACCNCCTYRAAHHSGSNGAAHHCSAHHHDCGSRARGFHT